VTRILLTGKNGQVGWELQRTLATLGDVVALDRAGLDLADPDSIRRAVREHQPNLIVNAAAYTAVDKAESEPDLAMAINGTAPGILAEEAKRLGAALIHYSTDYVFDGRKNGPYTEDDPPHPLNVYGQTKLAGERAIQAAGPSHLILRPSWVYGSRGNNFLLTILRLAKERDELRIVNDQIGAPVWCRFVAEVTAQLIAQCYGYPQHAWDAGVSGIYHMTAAGQTSWHGFAQAILESAALSRRHTPRVTPIPSTEYLAPARRPKNSLLSSTKLHRVFGLTLPAWDTGLRFCLDEYKNDSSAAR
jgi:dTDP-4-dehydrorhamnose reductase